MKNTTTGKSDSCKIIPLVRSMLLNFRSCCGLCFSIAKESFGLSIAVVTGWLFVFWYITGGPAVDNYEKLNPITLSNDCVKDAVALRVNWVLTF
ncbi:MAG: hypothetical protein M1495_23230 [Bacteroidetes bacterium]|nr:hypothetical protein [Bacteroidota bacterium]MCL6098569.1 hypothetical protein [Bacteroidota bacterium]